MRICKLYWFSIVNKDQEPIFVSKGTLVYHPVWKEIHLTTWKGFLTKFE